MGHTKYVGWTDMGGVNERLAITVCVLIGFFATVMVYMLVPMDGSKGGVMQLVMTAEGTACSICLGFWFGPTGSK